LIEGDKWKMIRNFLLNPIDDLPMTFCKGIQVPDRKSWQLKLAYWDGGVARKNLESYIARSYSRDRTKKQETRPQHLRTKAITQFWMWVATLWFSAMGYVEIVFPIELWLVMVDYFVILFTIANVEMTLVVNNIYDVYTLDSAGQLVAFIVGLGTFITTIKEYLLEQRKERKDKALEEDGGSTTEATSNQTPPPEQKSEITVTTKSEGV